MMSEDNMVDETVVIPSAFSFRNAEMVVFFDWANPPSIPRDLVPFNDESGELVHFEVGLTQRFLVSVQPLVGFPAPELWSEDHPMNQVVMAFERGGKLNLMAPDTFSQVRIRQQLEEAEILPGEWVWMMVFDYQEGEEGDDRSNGSH